MNQTDQLCVNTLRFLAVDAVEKAKSGHPGLPLGAAPMAYVLWDRFMKHNPAQPAWVDRDRFILSAGHGSALLYAMLHTFGYGLPLEELKKFKEIKEVRGCGLMIGMEFDQPVKEIRSRLIHEQKVFTGASGTNVIRLLPPLCLSKEEADEFLARLRKVLG